MTKTKPEIKKRAVKKAIKVVVCSGSSAGCRATLDGKYCEVHNPIDIPVLRKVIILEETEEPQKDLPEEKVNWYQVALLVVGILLVIAYCTGIERAAGL